MAKGYNIHSKLQGVKALMAMHGLLKEKYDPEIMAEILKDPEIKEVIKQQKIKSDFELALFKGMLVREGTYEFFIKNKVNEVK